MKVKRWCFKTATVGMTNGLEVAGNFLAFLFSSRGDEVGNLREEAGQGHPFNDPRLYKC